MSRKAKSEKTGRTSTRRLDIATTPLDTTTADIISELCDRFGARRQTASGDIVGGYRVSDVCAALKVPAQEWPLFARWATDFLNPASWEQLYAHLDVMIAQRCITPGDDLLSELMRLEVDGDGLTVDDLHTIVAALLAGIDAR